MEDNINVEDVTTSKRKIERSAAYPSITIEGALVFVSEIYKNFRNGFAKRDDIVDLIEGAHNRYIAASSYYGFLNREKDSYQVSQSYKDITTPISDKEKIKGILKAFESPKLNKELIEKFDGDVIPKELVAHLSKFHRITEEAAPLAADVFLENAKYCRVLDENNILNFKNVIIKLSDPNATFPKLDTFNTDSPIDKLNENGSEDTVVVDKVKPVLLLDQMVNYEEIKIRLTGGKIAMLKHPLSLTKTDIEIFKKEIELLELLVE